MTATEAGAVRAARPPDLVSLAATSAVPSVFFVRRV